MAHNHKDISDYFDQFLKSFYDIEKTKFNFIELEVSKSIYRHIFKIKSSLWKFGEEFNRKKRISISEIFQDLIALYLKLSLDEGYEIILEEKINHLQPDILVKYKGQNLFLIEVKTTLGWKRESLDGEIEKRISALSETFHVSKENVIYVFQSPWNVGKEFAKKYWDFEKGRAKNPPTEFPYNQIRPLLFADDPYYWSANKDKKHHEYSEMEIQSFAEKRIVVPLETTIEQIKKAALNIQN